MSIISKSLNPSLSVNFTGIIWKIETDDQQAIIAVETRDISTRQTHFSAYNFQTGQSLFNEITVPDSWFWSLDRVHKGIIYLHSYVHESNPEHKGIVAINAFGEIIWQHYHLTLYQVAQEGLVIYNPKIQPKTLELIFPDTGLSLGKSVVEFNAVERDIILPDYLEDTTQLSGLLPSNTLVPVFSQIVNRKTILAFHTESSGFFTQQLLIIEDNEVILQDILAEGIQKINPEAFFIERSHLFYIRNDKRQLVSYLV